MHRYLQIILLVSFTMLIQGCSDKTDTDNESNNSSSSSISSVNDADNNSSLSTSSSANSSSSTQQVVTSSSSSSTIAVITSSSSSTTSSSSSAIVVGSSSSSNSLSSSSSVTSSSSSTTSSSSSLSSNSSSSIDTNSSSSSSTSSTATVINGYTLPPEPDKTLNNSTLLGIDSNNNGVRDDVEIYVLNKYKDHHKIVSEIALQSGRAYQMALGDPSKAKESVVYMKAARACNWYFRDDADYYGDPIVMDDYITDKEFKDTQINTKDRIKAYLQYNRNLSGGVYRLTPSSKRKSKCDFNVTKLLED